MTTDWKKKRQRTEAVKAKALEPSHMFTRCRVVGCDKPARAGTSDGLDTRFCRSHAEHYSRHGSPYKGSYSASELRPHRKAAQLWLTENADNARVQNAITRVETKYRSAGPHIEAFRLRGLSPEERAKAAWARLREADVDPRKVLEAWITIMLTVRNDPKAEIKAEFQEVQVAKLVHRLVSGTHKRWSSGQELHKYPRSRGRVLRHLGQQITACCELLSPK